VLECLDLEHPALLLSLGRRLEEPCSAYSTLAHGREKTETARHSLDQRTADVCRCVGPSRSLVQGAKAAGQGDGAAFRDTELRLRDTN
jgi:hypothetical protein